MTDIKWASRRKIMYRERCRILWNRREKDSYMNRFGGGVRFSLGVEVGNSLRAGVVNCGFGYLTIRLGKKKT